jgi:hypothetical protein
LARLTQARKTITHEESKMQQSCVLWFRIQYRKLMLFAIPNGAKLSGNQEQRAISGRRLKLEGVVPGVADLFLMVPSGDYCGLFLEAKTETGRQQDSQKEFEAAALSAGYGYAVFRSLGEFQYIVRSYLNDGIY